MYVDKKLAGVKAVQTLSRLNRIHPAKTDTFVLDFANTAEEIQDAFAAFFEQTAATPTDPNVLYTLQRTLLDAGVIDPTEMATAVAALLAGGSARQKTVYANLNPAADRFIALGEDDQFTFRDALKSYVRAYAFLAQVMPWTEADLESLYLYGKALAPLLPAAPGDPLPQISDSVLLTHLRTAARAEEENLSLTHGADEPGTALPGEGTGKITEGPVERLSQLIATLNDKFGMDLNDADRVWFEQQKQAVKDNEQPRVVARHNDRDQYRIVLEKNAEDMIIDRHESNGMLFNAFFENPGFRGPPDRTWAAPYDEFRGEGVS